MRERLFGEIVGTSKTWETNTLIVEDEYRTMEGTAHPVKLLLSHNPQRDLQGCDYNLFGHIHNMLLRNPDLVYSEFQWMYPDSPDSPWINVCVELIGYQPRSFQELYDMKKHMGLRLL